MGKGGLQHDGISDVTSLNFSLISMETVMCYLRGSDSVASETLHLFKPTSCVSVLISKFVFTITIRP